MDCNAAPAPLNEAVQVLRVATKTTTSWQCWRRASPQAYAAARIDVSEPSMPTMMTRGPSVPRSNGDATQAGPKRSAWGSESAGVVIAAAFQRCGAGSGSVDRSMLLRSVTGLRKSAATIPMMPIAAEMRKMCPVASPYAARTMC